MFIFLFFISMFCLSNANFDFVTNPMRSDGFGAQFQTIITSAIYAEVSNKKFLYSPFKSMEHNYDNDPDFLEKKENLINFRNHFELNKLGIISSNNYIDFFEQNLEKALATNVLKKIKTIFRQGKTKENYFLKDRFCIAIHIRRPNIHDNRLDGADTPNNFFLALIEKMRISYIEKNPVFYIFSQGNDRDFYEFINDDTIICLNDSIENTFSALVFADVLVLSRSSFSYTAGLISESIIYYLPFWHAPMPHWINAFSLIH